MYGKLLIFGGIIVDPASNVNASGDVWIDGDKISDVNSEQNSEAVTSIDVTGCYAFPGLIDYHTHLFYGGTAIGVSPDLALLPQGVTTAVDQGSAGVINFERFMDSVVARQTTRIFGYLHVNPTGLASLPHSPEDVDPAHYDLQQSRNLFEQYAGQLLGLKIRSSREIVKELGLQPLRQTIHLAEQLGCRVVVHTTNPPTSVGELADLLRAGDVYTHMYQGKGSSIIADDGKLAASIRQARERGVVFDTADGRAHYALSVAAAALAEGFMPDIISTDLTLGNVYDPSVFGLPFIMSKYLALGISLADVVNACTAAPAKLLGMEGKLGTLTPGAYADVSVFRLVKKRAQFTDFTGQTLVCEQLLVPQLTVSHGKVVYRSLEL